MVFAGRLLNMIQNGRPRLTQGWSKAISLNLVGGLEPNNGIICHRPPIDKGIGVLISQKEHTNENITMCHKLIHSRQPLLLPVQYILEENNHNLLIVQERPGMSLREFFNRHMSQFFVGHGEKVLYVTPLFQRLLRDMILATEELHHMGLNIFPLESSVFINIGEAGTLTTKISALRCVDSTSTNYKDPIVGHCAEIMTKFAEIKEASIPELADLLARATTGKWWRDLHDVWTHPLFWTSQMHDAFLSNMDLHIYARPIKTEEMEKLIVSMQTKIKGLQDFAHVLKDEWDCKTLDSWKGNWAEKLRITKPKKWESLDDHHEKILRSVRNLLSHHNDLNYFRCSNSWGNRKELFIHAINQTHNLSIMLFETYLEIKKKYMEKTLQATRTTENWDDVLSSILPKDNSHSV